eukprot:CAMPEP_0204379466 /NCGR_PEP_ID=MMETSP0469-20131031/52630_1 /ASSEMBLY_ACC=CAM_ASM_000384 /TAXON_ID=2969 /ORGANISM="Oxyrrhis marina" /LENGTH=35 /DNA_ID= /DNA_START= /DNA_END= /DNA_ORIENTATION=
MPMPMPMHDHHTTRPSDGHLQASKVVLPIPGKMGR